MPKKKDPSVTFLNRFGYNVVKLPRAGIEPMDVIGRDDTTQWLGPLRSVWTSSAPEPAVSAPRPAAPINGEKTDRLDLAFGLRILSNALAAFGASTPSLDAAYRRARNVQFSYTNVMATAVPVLDAGNYLADGSLNTSNPAVRHYFTDPDTQAFLIVEVLKSDSVTVTATDEHGVEVGVDVPALEQVLGAKVKVSRSGSDSATVTFKGDTPVTFAFIVNEIDYEAGRWSLQGAAPSGSLAFGAGAVAPVSATEAPLLLGTGCRVAV